MNFLLMVIFVTGMAGVHPECSFVTRYEDAATVRVIQGNIRTYRTTTQLDLSECLSQCSDQSLCRSVVYEGIPNKTCHLSTEGSSLQFCDAHERIRLSDLSSTDIAYLECVSCVHSESRREVAFKQFTAPTNRTSVWMHDSVNDVYACAEKCENNPFCHSAIFNRETTIMNCGISHNPAPCQTESLAVANELGEVWIGCF